MSKLDALLKYHDAVQEQDRLEGKLASSEAHKRLGKLHGFLKEQQAQITTLQKQIDARVAAVGKLKAQFEELTAKYELELSEFELMEKDADCTAAEITESRKAMEALLDRLGAARKDLFNMLNFIEKAEADYKATYQKAGKAKREFDAVRAECEKEAESSKPELEAARAAVEAAKKGVDPALLQRYARVKSHHAVPMALVANNQCGGCNMSLPTAVVKRVSAGTDVVECENCGRILYIT